MIRGASALTALTALLLVFPACGGSVPKPMPAVDLVAFGHVWTGDSTRPWAEAVAVRGDTIAALGDSAAIGRLAGPETRVLRGAMVVPGFADGHLHFLAGGYQLSSVDLRSANTPDEFVARLKAFVSEKRPGEWIVGGDWDHERWPGAPLPTRAWVDSVTPDNPVLLTRLDGHMGLANSAALAAAGITRETRDIAGGTIVRDPRTGEPTGILKDEAMTPVYRVIPPPTDAQDDAALDRALAFAASKGVTAVGAMSAPWSEVAAFKRARAGGRLTLRVALFPDLHDWRRVADTLKRYGPGDDWIRLAGVKGYVDGSLGSGTAFFFEPYADDPATRGLLVTPEDTLRTLIAGADGAGLQIAVHAIGERANAIVLDIYDSVAKIHGARDRRFRIEHAQHLRPADAERLAAMGIVASMQPYHAIDDGRWAEKRIGPARIHNMYVFKTLLDRHAHLAFGSDWTVAPIDPLLGIYAAVTRRTLDDKNPDGWTPDQKIAVEDALRAYTAGNAYGLFAERTRGRLAPGYLADLVVLDQDLTAIAPVDIQHVQVRATVVDGKVVYERR